MFIIGADCASNRKDIVMVLCDFCGKEIHDEYGEDFRTRASTIGGETIIFISCMDEDCLCDLETNV